MRGSWEIKCPAGGLPALRLVAPVGFWAPGVMRHLPDAAVDLTNEAKAQSTRPLYIEANAFYSNVRGRPILLLFKRARGNGVRAGLRPSP